MPINPDSTIGIDDAYGVRPATCADNNQGYALSSEHTGGWKGSSWPTTPVACRSHAPRLLASPRRIRPPTLLLPIVVTEPARIKTYLYDDYGRQLSCTVEEH